MTHTSTEQERASLSSFIDRAGRDGFDTAHNFFDCGEVVFFNHATADLWNFWQAARRAPAVPQGWTLAIGLCELVECENAGDSDFERGMRTAAKRIRKELGAAAPQPPEVEIQPKVCKTEIQTIGCIEAAPVQLPEPRIFWIEATTQFCIKRGGEVPFASAWEPLYTEQQVRQLLASANKPE